jgi:hypothetical protein
MPFRAGILYSVVAVVLALAGCTGVEKSENVLAPTVAGPIPGVSIGMPTPLDPKDGKNIPVGSQTIDLMIQNSPTNGQRPLKYLFEVASDTNFNSILFSKSDVAPNDANRTTVRLPDAIATSRTYFWRARAYDGANTGPYSGFAHFNIYTPIVIDKPVPREPVNGITLAGLSPTFVFANAPRSGPVGAIVYTIEVADSDSFGNRYAVWSVAEQPSQTSLAAPSALPQNKMYFWRVTAGGPWSTTQTFKTPLVTPPTPAPGPGTPTPVPGNCTLPQGSVFDTLQCARQAYPHPMSGTDRGKLLNQVAWYHRAAGWGMHDKPGGNNCPQAKTGRLISCDILVHGPVNGIFEVYDVLLNEEDPAWQFKGTNPDASIFVAAVQP